MGAKGDGQPARAGRVTYPVIDPSDIERRVACMDCRRPFRPGDRYAERLIGFIEDAPLTEVVCVACDYAGTPV